MKRWHIVLMIIGSIAIVVNFIISPVALMLGGAFSEIATGTNAEIEIDSYRLCKDKNGEDVIIIKYLLRNEGSRPTCLRYEGEFLVYQNGVSLTEYYEELPKESGYDTEDQYKNVKGGVEYLAEIAYSLDHTDADVVVEVKDYGFFGTTKEKTFQIK